MPKLAPRYHRRASCGSKAYRHHAPAIAAARGFVVASPRRVSFDDSCHMQKRATDSAQTDSECTLAPSLPGPEDRKRLRRSASSRLRSSSSLIRPTTSPCLADLANQYGVNDHDTTLASKSDNNLSPSNSADVTSSYASLASGSVVPLAHLNPVPVSPMPCQVSTPTSTARPRLSGAQSYDAQQQLAHHHPLSPSNWGQFVETTHSGEEEEEHPTIDDGLLGVVRESFVPHIAYTSIRRSRRACPYQKLVVSTSKRECHQQDLRCPPLIPLRSTEKNMQSPTTLRNISMPLPQSIASFNPRKEHPHNRSHTGDSRRGVADQLSAALHFLRVD